jgi:hypothetical protein
MATYAPQNPYPEGQTTRFERTYGPNRPGGRGPLRFEEGVATDTDVPYDFGRGAYGDTDGDMRGRPDRSFFYKFPEETMQQRAHVGSATWISAPEVLGDFVQGAVAGDAQPSFEYAYNTGMHMNRPAPTRIDD